MSEEDEMKVLFKKLDSDFELIRDLRSRVFTVHLHIEYWLEKIIDSLLPQPKYLLDEDEDLSSFSNKLRILATLGFFQEKPGLCENINLINKIRNRYAHELLSPREKDGKIEAWINSLEESKSQPFGCVR